VRFPGQYFNDETGLHYNYYRYYDPKTGRYLRPDILDVSHVVLHLNQDLKELEQKLRQFVFRSFIDSFVSDPQNIEQYSYSFNNPVNFVDTFGLKPKIKRPKNLKDWKDAFDMAKDLYDECTGDLNDLDNCLKCCKKIAQSIPGLEADPLGWWMPFEQCQALMCLQCI
jgi:hypothetical protein